MKAPSRDKKILFPLMVLVLAAAVAVILLAKRRTGTDACRIDEAPAFMDVTELVLDNAEGLAVCSCGMYDGNTLLILLADPEKEVCHARLLDLEKGRLRDLLTFPFPGGSTENIRILSADPLIISDDAQGIVYRPQTDAAPFRVPCNDEYPPETVSACGALYLFSPAGILSRCGDDGSVTEIWRLPRQCSWLTQVADPDDGSLLFSTYPEDRPDMQIFAQVDPESGEAAYFTYEGEDLYFGAGSDGKLCAIRSDPDPVLTVWDTAAGILTEYELPQAIRPDPSRSLMLAPQPAAGHYCCFALCDEKGRPERICLCDLSDERCGQRTARAVPEKIPYVFPHADYGDLSARAEAIYEKYGVHVVLGTDVPAVFPDYSVQTEDNYYVMENGLSTLESALSLYPGDYFRALCGLYYRDITFYLTGPMTPLYADQNISEAGAFTVDQNTVAKVALNLQAGLYRGIILHELTHVTDYALLKKDLLREEEWSAMNPSGFQYYDAYMDENGSSYDTVGDPSYTAAAEEDPERIYFYDRYSKTFALEDRAQLMQVLMRDMTGTEGSYTASAPPDLCLQSSHTRAKMRWYAALIRDALDTGSWPRRTCWEAALDR
ncbi:MAG: hypothetical protein IJG52_02000 [Lachnospiraceae bacterium]|nr:hypothetical protein [Lachnospiraceae bacterium]